MNALLALAAKALLPGLFAGLVAVAVTVIIERWGGRVGGVIGTLPSTIVPAAIGMAAEASDPAAFVRAINIAPAGILLNALFLYLWRVLPPRLPPARLRAKLALMIAVSLSAWIGAAAATVLGVDHLLSAGLSPRLVGLLATLALFGAGLGACLRSVPAPRGQRRVGPATLIARGLLAAVAVGASAVLAASGIELVAGIASVFPAIFLTTMVSLWVSQGEAVPAGAVGPMMLGATSVAVFCLAASVTLPRLGAAAGAVSAWLLAAAVVTLPVSIWLQRRGRSQRLAT